MSRRRAAISVLILAIGGWVVWISFSLSQVGGSLPALPELDRGAVPNPAEPAPAAAAPAEAEPPPIEQAAEGLSAAAAPIEAASAPEEEVTETDFASGTDFADYEPIIPVVRCWGWEMGTFPGDTALWHDGALYSMYRQMSDQQLKALADSGKDGLAQYMYAFDRLLGLKDVRYSDPVSGRPLVGYQAPDVSLALMLDQHQSFDDEVFEKAKSYFIDALRNHTWKAANRLSTITYASDKIEARAWLVIEQLAGGRGLYRREDGGVPDQAYEYSDDEKLASDLLAYQLIDEYDLNPGLSPPQGCL